MRLSTVESMTAIRRSSFFCAALIEGNVNKKYVRLMSQQQGKNLNKQEQSKFTQRTESKWWDLCSVFPLLFVLEKVCNAYFRRDSV